MKLKRKLCTVLAVLIPAFTIAPTVAHADYPCGYSNNWHASYGTLYDHWGEPAGHVTVSNVYWSGYGAAQSITVTTWARHYVHNVTVWGGNYSTGYSFSGQTPVTVYWVLSVHGNAPVSVARACVDPS